MKVAVIGSRSFNNYDLLKKTLTEMDAQLIISGGARGADTLAEKYAKENGIPTLIFLADWDRYGKSAGYRRNVDIIANADCVVAFWDGVSKGTKHSIDLAYSAGKEVKIINFLS